jgi:hypothetical protein
VVFVERHNVLGTRRDRYSVQGGTVFELAYRPALSACVGPTEPSQSPMTASTTMWPPAQMTSEEAQARVPWDLRPHHADPTSRRAVVVLDLIVR